MPKLKATAGLDIEDGTYEATLLEIQLADPTEKSPKKHQWLKWIFQVYDGSDDGVEMAVGSSLALSPKSKARGWLEALLARKIAINEEIDTDSLCPKDCQVTIKRDLESGFAKIIEVMAPRRRPSPRPAAARTPAPAQRVEGVIVDDDIPF